MPPKSIVNDNHSGRYLALVLLLCFIALGIAGWSQTRPGRPALIRDTDKAEGKEEEESSKEKPYNPLMAEKSIKVGDFYFKKKNYSAAIQRYLEALSHQPNLIRAYESLGKAYEKDGKTGKAVELYKDFLKKYPSSPKAPDFQARIAQLEKKHS